MGLQASARGDEGEASKDGGASTQQERVPKYTSVEDADYSLLLTKAKDSMSSSATATVNDGDNNDNTGESSEGIRLGRGEAISIPTHCPSCGVLGDSLTALTDIPHFKEV